MKSFKKPEYKSCQGKKGMEADFPFSARIKNPTPFATRGIVPDRFPVRAGCRVE